MRAYQASEAVQVLQGRDVDVHHVPGQHDAAGDALPLPEELGRIPHQEARLRDRDRHGIPVLVRVLAANGKILL